MFNIKTDLNLNKSTYLTLILESKEHFVEFRDRLLQLFVISTITFLLVLCSINVGAEIILRLIPEIQFFQLSPQEFLITSLVSLLNLSIILLYPYIIRNLIFFFGPSLLLTEKKLLFPLITISILFSVLAISFSFSVLAPTTFEFFLNYNSNNIEPFWSFKDFSSFLIGLIYIDLILFQLPLLQITLTVINLITVETMIQNWKNVLLFAFLLSGIVTPSTDPFTQILLALTICLLYGSGIFFSKLLYSK